MANEPSVKGTSVLLGFATGTTVTGIIRDTHDTETTADIETVRDESNNEASFIVSNLGARLTVSGECSSAQTTKKGDIVTVNSVKYICENAVERRTKLKCRFDLTLYKTDAVTFT